MRNAARGSLAHGAATDPAWFEALVERHSTGPYAYLARRYLGQSFDANEKALTRLGWWFLGAMVLTGALALALLLAIWRNA